MALWSNSVIYVCRKLSKRLKSFAAPCFLSCVHGNMCSHETCCHELIFCFYLFSGEPPSLLGQKSETPNIRTHTHTHSNEGNNVLHITACVKGTQLNNPSYFFYASHCNTNSIAFNTNEFAALVLISVLDDTTNNLHSVLRRMSNLLTDGPRKHTP